MKQSDQHKAEIKRLRAALFTRTSELAEAEAALRRRRDQLAEYQRKVGDLEAAIDYGNQTRQQLNHRIDDLSNQLLVAGSMRDKHLADLRGTEAKLAEATKRYDTLSETITTWQDKCKALETTIAEYSEYTKELHRQLTLTASAAGHLAIAIEHQPKLR